MTSLNEATHSSVAVSISLGSAAVMIVEKSATGNQIRLGFYTRYRVSIRYRYDIDIVLKNRSRIDSA
jgi:hypothetical protein